MNIHAEKLKNNKNQAAANKVTQRRNDRQFSFQFVDNRPEAKARNFLQKIADNSPQSNRHKDLAKRINSHSKNSVMPNEKYNSNSQPIQLALDGSGLTIPLIGEKAESDAYGLYQWSNGSFISSEQSDTNTYEVHVHNYGVVAADDDNVTLTGHAVWKKQFGTTNRNQQPLTVTGTRNGDRWDATLALAPATINILGSAVTAGKTDLFNDVVNPLGDIVKDTLNEE